MGSAKKTSGQRDRHISPDPESFSVTCLLLVVAFVRDQVYIPSPRQQSPADVSWHTHFLSDTSVSSHISHCQ